MNWLKTRFLAYGFLVGTAGIKALTSDEAKKIYTHITAAGMRCADDVLRLVEDFKENCEDIAADARAINEEKEREFEERLIADAKAVLAAAEEE